MIFTMFENSFNLKLQLTTMTCERDKSRIPIWGGLSKNNTYNESVDINDSNSSNYEF